MKPPLYLNLGCGDKVCQAHFPWINIDSNPVTEPDVVADVRELPYEDGEVDMVYAGHVLEHLSRDDGVPRCLGEIQRVLSEFGQACFVGPDYNRALTNPAWHDMLEQIRFGDYEHMGSEHLWTSTVGESLLAVRKVFPDAREIDIVCLSSFWPIVANVGWQFALLVEE